MALWILSKTSMVFFIIALFAIVVAGTDLWKKSFCSSQADVLASQITDVMNQIINSPLEDEKRIFALESVLSIGGEKLQKYNIDVSFIPDQQTYPVDQSQDLTGFVRYNGRINVKVATEEGCSASRTISFNDFVTLSQTFDLKETEDPTYINDGKGYYAVDDLLYDKNTLSNNLKPYLKRIRIAPSFRDLSSHPSTYMIFIKCTSKNSPKIPLASKFFILDNCNDEPDACLKLNTETDAYANIVGTTTPSITINEICQQNAGTGGVPEPE